MKKSTLGILALALVITTSCNTSAEKLENAQEGVNAANLKLEEANEAYLLDMENFKKESNDKIIANEKSFSEFNERIESEKKEVKTEYKNKISDLNQKNTDLKKRLDDYKISGKDNWEIFKAEFAHDMAQLGVAFNDLTLKNTK